MNRADRYQGLPPSRKRRGWKKEFLESLAEAAKETGEVSEEEILRSVRSYRKREACVFPRAATTKNHLFCPLKHLAHSV